MPNMPDSYYDNFNASKNYEKILYRDGYTLQGAGRLLRRLWRLPARMPHRCHHLYRARSRRL